MTKQRVIFILETLKNMFPDAWCELNFSNPFQLVVSVILSAQTTDKQVNKITDNLYKKIKTPQDVLDMWYENFEKNIKSIWLYKSKWHNIYRLSEILSKDKLTIVSKTWFKLSEKYWYTIPDTMAELIKLPWIWEKTAKVVLFELYKQRVVAADTHVHRISNRLGMVNTKIANQTSNYLEKIIPDNYKDLAHHLFIFFGRYHCKAIRPNCNNCPFTDFCKYYRSKNTKK